MRRAACCAARGVCGLSRAAGRVGLQESSVVTRGSVFSPQNLEAYRLSSQQFHEAATKIEGAIK